MNILIIGANGLLGKELVEILSSEHKVYACIREEASNTLKETKNVEILNLDLYKLETFNFPSKIDSIYYLAQSNRYREFPEGAMDMLEVNIYSPLKVINWAINNGVKQFFYTSTGGVYKNPQTPVDEFFKIDANEKANFYISSKLSAEILLKNYASLFESFAVLRPFFIYGKGQKQSMLIPRLIQNILDEKEILLSGDEGIKINPIHVKDAARALKKLLELKGEFLFNIAGSEIISLKKLCILIGSIVDKNPRFKKVENKAQNDLIADIELMEEKLHKPNITLHKGVTSLTSK